MIHIYVCTTQTPPSGPDFSSCWQLQSYRQTDGNDRVSQSRGALNSRHHHCYARGRAGVADANAINNSSKARSDCQITVLGARVLNLAHEARKLGSSGQILTPSFGI